jgi:type IX secretion system PorP/SprF family membrane protein
MWKKLLIAMVVMSGEFTSLNAQDMVLSQYYATPMKLNPALTGSALAPRVQLAYRNQWPLLPNAYTSYYAAYDHYIESARSGIGLSVMADNAGDGIYKTTTLNLSYAYQMPLNREWMLAGGLNAGIAQARLNWDKLIFYDQLNPVTGFDESISTQEERPSQTSRLYPDFGAGLVVASERYFGGFSLQHLNAPDESLYKNDNVFAPVPLRITLHGGMQFPLFQNDHRKKNGNSYFSPNILVTKQANFYQFNLGGYAQLGLISVGTWFRYAGNSDAVIMSLGFHKDIFRLGYSYDVTLSQARVGGGAHEITVGINFGDDPKFKRNARQKQYGNCMKIFR